MQKLSGIATDTLPAGPRSAWDGPHLPSLHDVADAATLDLAFKALANENGRGILAVLHDCGGSLGSHDIARRFDIPWQGVSRPSKAR